MTDAHSPRFSPPPREPSDRGSIPYPERDGPALGLRPSRHGPDLRSAPRAEAGPGMAALTPAETRENRRRTRQRAHSRAALAISTAQQAAQLLQHSLDTAYRRRRIRRHGRSVAASGGIATRPWLARLAERLRLRALRHGAAAMRAQQAAGREADVFRHLATALSAAELCRRIEALPRRGKPRKPETTHA